MNLYGISSILTGITSLILAGFVYIKGYNHKLARIWSAFALSAAVYGFGAYLVTLSKNASQAFFWWQVAYIGIILLPFFFVRFIFEFLTIKNPLFIKLTNLFTAIFLVTDIFSKKLFLNECTLYFTQMKGVRPIYFVYPPGPLLKIFIIFSFFGWVAYGNLELLKHYKKLSSLKRIQAKYFLFANILGFLGGGASFLPCFGISFYPFLNFAVPFYFFMMSYAILRYRLMDVSVTFTRTGIFVGVYTLVLGLPFLLAGYAKAWLIALLGVNWWLGPLFLGTILATAGPFAYIYFQKRAEALLLREQRNYQEILRQTAMGMTRIRNPKELFDLIVNILTETVSISYSVIYLLDNKTGSFILKAGRNIEKGQIKSIDKNSALIDWLQKNKKPLLYEEVKQKYLENHEDDFKGMEEEMSSLNATVVVPSFLEDKLLDLIVLGDKLQGRAYTSEDLNIFSVLAGQAALAIENASLYENIEEKVKQRTKELVEVQKQLVHAEKLATVGTLAGGVAHEINNPLTAILTNVQMLLADNEPDRESLEMIEEATKRCKTIVQKLMTFSQKPMANTMMYQVNVLDIVQHTVNFLKFQLEQENITLEVLADKNSYSVRANHDELEQVLTNIVLNAKDAIKQIKKNGTVYISVSENENSILISVKDDGAGIPKAILNRIFDPFYTTKEVGKGLGLGLSICQTIIEKHKGKILVESQENKGSTFTIQLPKIK
jgi:signal transduction histidine kinase